MARRRRRGPRDDEPTLFDAPLNPSAEEDAPEPPTPPRQRPPASAPSKDPSSGSSTGPSSGPFNKAGESLPLFPEAEPDPELDLADPLQGEGAHEDGFAAEVDGEEPLEGGEPASVPARLLAGLADVAIHAGVVALLLWGVHSFGVSISLDLAPALGLFLVAFSFLYTVVPLAFWGQTPGMASLGLLTCTADDQHLTFAQTARRWLAAVLTLALVGLPTLLAVGGRRSLADLASGSVTLQLPEA